MTIYHGIKIVWRTLKNKDSQTLPQRDWIRISRDGANESVFLQDSLIYSNTQSANTDFQHLPLACHSLGGNKFTERWEGKNGGHPVYQKIGIKTRTPF